MPLLADQVLAKGVAHNPSVNRALSTAIRGAHVFDMDGDFGAAADQLRGSRPSSFKNVIPLCLLPYESCWFEVGQRHRSGFVTGETYADQDPSAVDRVGVLVNVAKDNPGHWEMSLFWSFVDGRVSMSYFDSVISFEEIPRLTTPHKLMSRTIIEEDYRGKEVDAATALFSRMGMRPGRFRGAEFDSVVPHGPTYRKLFQ